MSRAKTRTEGLAQLLSVHGRDTFLSRAWPNTFHVSHGTLDASCLPSGITDIERSVSSPGVHTTVFGPKGFRVDAANARDALTFYRAGHTLYLMTMERAFPELDRLCSVIARDLQVDPAWMTVEGFASPKKGAGTSMHYDFDVNFNVQLVGSKVWRVAPNEHMHNPLTGLTVMPGTPLRSSFDGRVLPSKMPKGARSLRMRPGDVLFLPRAHWHETTVESESFAIAFVLKPPPMFQLVINELTNALKQDPQWRAYPLGQSREEDLTRVLAKLPEIARTIRANDILFNQRWMRWKHGVARELRDRPWRLVIDGVGELALDAAMVGAAQWLTGSRDVFAPEMCSASTPTATRELLRQLIVVGAIELIT